MQQGYTDAAILLISILIIFISEYVTILIIIMISSMSFAANVAATAKMMSLIWNYFACVHVKMVFQGSLKSS